MPGDTPLGRARQLRVDIAIVLSLLPTWLKRAFLDRNDAKARNARDDIVERVAVALERRFHITWHGSDDISTDAEAPNLAGPLFGGPEPIDSDPIEAEHKGNI